MENINVLSDNTDSTVISKFEVEKKKEDSYQTEAELEKEFIKMLTEQSYEYLQLHTEDELVLNLKMQLEKLNKMEFSDKEWDYLWNKIIQNDGGIVEKTRIIQEDNIQTITLDDGTQKNITLIDKKNIHNNS